MTFLETVAASRDHLSVGVVGVFIGLWIFLLTATGVGQVLRVTKPGKTITKVNQIIRAWWVIAGFFTAVMWLGPTAMVLFMGFVSYLALKEFYSLVPTRRADRRALFWSYGAILVQYFAISQDWFILFLLYIPLYHLLMGPMRLVVRGRTEHFVRSSSTIHWGLMLAVFNLSHVAYLMVLPMDGNPNGGGPGMVLYLIILTELNDVAQFIWGKSFGKHKVAPSVSPNKTWEGLLGGLGTTSVLSMIIAPVLTPMTTLQAFGLGLSLSMLGFVGDVVMSAVKRDMQVKDSSSLIPGHGGVLDRVDSLSYTAPVAFYFFYFQFYA